MSLSLEEVEKIANLSRLKFTEAEKQKMQTELTDILNYVDQIKTLADKIEVSLDQNPDGVNLMRDDVAEPVENPEKFLAQAPAKEGPYLRVKSILE